MECIYGFASSISRYLVCGAINQLRYPCCFNNFIEELAKEEGNLIATRDSVQDRVVHAKKQTRKTSEVVNKWLEDAKIVEDNVNDLLKKARTEKSCSFGHCPNWISRYHLGKKLANKKRDLGKCIEEGRQYIQLERIATLPSDILDFPSERYLNFESRQYAYEQLMEALKDDEVTMIGLYGMGGSGKTMLAMEVEKIAKEEEHLFNRVLFVTVSSTVEVRRIQEKIASSMEYNFPENEERERAKRLNMRLNQENKILVILDDVWQMLDFGAIGIPSTEHHKGCKVLITTRLEAVCTLMDCQKKIQLQILTDEETWSLFRKQARICEGTSDTLKHLAREISDDCKGLPVAIAAVASSLKGKDEVVWKVALNKLRSSKPVNIEKGLQDPYKCLQLSYDNLDIEEAKSLFLLCSVFPEDTEIPIELLIRCAIGLGVVGEVRSYREARSEVIAAKMKLISSCLLLDAKNECVKMHDLVRDVAHFIAKNENKVIKCIWEKDVTLEPNSIRYLCCSAFPIDLECSNLEFLCLVVELEELDEIFKRMGKLRVLFLINDKDQRRLSTMSFRTLTNLRCLILSRWKLSDISFISDMKKLESLALFDCYVPSFVELQNDGVVAQLTNLKSLMLYKCEMERNNFEVIGRNPQLEELCIINRGQKLDDYNEFFNTFSVSQELQWYTIKLGSLDCYDDDDDADFISHERTVWLSCFHISNEAIKGLAKKAKVLSIANIQGGAKNIVPDIFQLEGGGIHDLNELQICYSKEIECLVDTSNHLSEVGILFSKLLKLRIYKMDHLRVLWHGCLPPSGPFEKLEKLYLSDCSRLTSLFTHAIAQSPALSTIFQNLQEVEVKGCTNLKYVFSANTVGGLPQLKVLNIKDCCMLDQIIEDIVPSTPVTNYPLAHQDQKQESDEIIEDKQHQYFLNPHFEANQFENFPESTSIPSGPVMNHSSGSFTLSSLTSLTVELCPKMHTLFTECTAKSLTSLEELTIQSCYGLKHILTRERAQNQKENLIEGDHDFQSDISMFLSLKRLYIRRCDLWQLQHIFSVSFVGGLVKLKDKRNKDTPDLKCQNNFEDASCHVQQKNIQIGQQVSLGLEELVLENLSQMTYIWVASKNSFALQYLKRLEIVGCAKLEVIFPLSVLRCLPDLKCLEIRECKELKQIMEEDAEDKKLSNLLSTQPCFPKLAKLVVEQCHKLKRLFSVSASNDLPNLEELFVNGAAELEEIIGREQGASKNSFTFRNLKRLEIRRCAKLEVIFPPSVLGCLLELERQPIMACEELKQIMEDNKLSNLVSPKPFFPKLAVLVVQQCHKLKRLFLVSTSNDLPNLQLLVIFGAAELEKLIECEQRKGDEIGKAKVELPKLKLLIFMHLYNLRQGTELLTVKHRFVRICPKLRLTSATSLDVLVRNFPYRDFKDIGLLPRELKALISQIIELDKVSTTISISVFPSSQKIEEIAKKRFQEGPPLEGAKVKTLLAGVDSISLASAVANHNEASERDILAQFSQFDEQDDKLNEGKRGITPGKKIQIQEGANLLDKTKGIGIVSNNCIEVPPASADTCTRLVAYKHFVDLDDAQMALLAEAITAYPHLWNACEKFSERFQAWMLKTLADLLLFLQNESVVSVTPQREKEFHRLCDEAVELGFERSWVDEMRHRVVVRDPKLEEARTDELSKRSSGADMVPDSQVVEQGDDDPNEHWKGTSPCPKIQNVDNSVQEGSNLIDKEGEIGVVSDDCIVSRRNEEPEKEFVAKVSTSEIPAIATSLTNSKLVERSSPIYLDVPPHKTHSNGLVDRKLMSEPCLVNQHKPLGEIVSTAEIPQSIKRVAEEGTISKNTNMEDSSLRSESTSSQSGQLVASQNKSYPHRENRRSQTETYTAKESEGHAKNIQDFGANVIMNLFQPMAVEEDGECQVTASSVVAGTKDKCVVKALADLEKCLKMPLKDIASSETNSLCLLTYLKFLSNLPFKDATLSDGLNDIIDSMHKEFPSILCSFKQGLATTDKLAVLEAHRNEAAITLVSKISEAGCFMDEAQQKEAVLKERVIRLKKEIKDCEAALSSLQEEKKKCIAETIGYKKERENVRKEKSEMVEDQRKVRQELFEVAYKWSALCSQFEHNRMAARNPS